VLFSVVFLKNTVRMSSSTASLNMAAILTAFVIALIPLILISMSGPNIGYNISIPIVAYIITSGMSAIYEYSKCNTLNISRAFLTNLLVFAATAFTSAVLFFEQIPIMKSFYPDGYPPRNPVSGLPYSPDSAEYIEGLKNENHYKLQLFTSIVKAVIPVYISENIKLGIVYFYWLFFLTLLPFYFILSLQSVCK